MPEGERDQTHLHQGILQILQNLQETSPRVPERRTRTEGIINKRFKYGHLNICIYVHSACICNRSRPTCPAGCGAQTWVSGMGSGHAHKEAKDCMGSVVHMHSFY